MHCLSRTPSSQKSQLGNNYSALSLKFGPIDPSRVTTVNRQHYIIPSGSDLNSGSEIIEIKEIASIDEIRTFRTDVPYVMDNPYHPVVRFEPVNYSISQHTASTSISRTSSLKSQHAANESRLNSIAKKLKKCTQKAFIIKPYAADVEKIPNGIVAAVKTEPSEMSAVLEKNSSLREADEDFMNGVLQHERRSINIGNLGEGNPSTFV